MSNLKNHTFKRNETVKQLKTIKSCLRDNLRAILICPGLTDIKFIDTGFSFLVKHQAHYYSSKMDIFVLNANKMCKYDQTITCISLKISVLLS